VGRNVGVSFITPELPEGCAENKQILLLGSVLPVRYKLCTTLYQTELQSCCVLWHAV